MAASYTSGPSAEPLLGDTIGGLLARMAREHPGREALVVRHQGVRLTYADLDEQTDHLARALVAAGLVPGDRVGIWSPNCAEWTLLQYASAKAGLILVNVNPAYRTHELGYVLAQSGMRMLVAARDTRGEPTAPIIDEARPGTLEQVVLLDTDGWPALLARGHDDIALPADLDCDDPINIQYTSGTTGAPKGATLTHHNIVNNAYFVGALCGYDETDRVCVPVPFYHCFGMVMGVLGAHTHGACTVVPAPSFDPAATLATIAEERCTSLYGVPTMFIAMLADATLASTDLASLRTGIMAGSPCPVEVMKRVTAEMHMPEVTIAYGMTETSPVSTQTRVDDDLERRVSTVGRVHPHVEVKVVDPLTGRTVPRGESGELCTRGYSIMRGYWDEPAKTAEVLDPAGWMHTGDLATMDTDGYLAIVGRSKDMVIRGGENIYPREVEEFLYGHPDIADVQVIGVPDQKYGEELMAWVVLRAGAEPLTAEAVREFCAGKLSHYKVPRYVHVVDGFPMTVTGKVRKVEMRAQAEKLLGG
ncbi:MAG TPA: AMP-binding protein [Mycobacteriales bacterium]